MRVDPAHMGLGIPHIRSDSGAGELTVVLSWSGGRHRRRRAEVEPGEGRHDHGEATVLEEIVSVPLRPF